eukprot:scaffold3310_cov121-Isochrysis_galbana.AAC.4
MPERDEHGDEQREADRHERQLRQDEDADHKQQLDARVQLHLAKGDAGRDVGEIGAAPVGLGDHEPEPVPQPVARKAGHAQEEECAVQAAVRDAGERRQHKDGQQHTQRLQQIGPPRLHDRLDQLLDLAVAEVDDLEGGQRAGVQRRLRDQPVAGGYTEQAAQQHLEPQHREVPVIGGGLLQVELGLLGELGGDVVVEEEEGGQHDGRRDGGGDVPRQQLQKVRAWHLQGGRDGGCRGDLHVVAPRQQRVDPRPVEGRDEHAGRVEDVLRHVQSRVANGRLRIREVRERGEDDEGDGGGVVGQQHAHLRREQAPARGTVQCHAQRVGADGDAQVGEGGAALAQNDVLGAGAEGRPRVQVVVGDDGGEEGDDGVVDPKISHLRSEAARTLEARAAAGWWPWAGDWGTGPAEEEARAEGRSREGGGLVDEADRPRGRERDVHQAGEDADPAHPRQKGYADLERQNVAHRGEDGHRHGDADDAQGLPTNEGPDDSGRPRRQQDLTASQGDCEPSRYK